MRLQLQLTKDEIKDNWNDIQGVQCEGLDCKGCNKDFCTAYFLSGLILDEPTVAKMYDIADTEDIDLPDDDMWEVVV